jgi:hypothetical protein
MQGPDAKGARFELAGRRLVNSTVGVVWAAAQRCSHTRFERQWVLFATDWLPGPTEVRRRSKRPSRRCSRVITCFFYAQPPRFASRLWQSRVFANGSPALGLRGKQTVTVYVSVCVRDNSSRF